MSRIDSRRFRARSGTNVQLQVALHAADRDCRVVADHLRGHLRDLGDDRVHLPGHDRAALLELGKHDLGETGSRARARRRSFAIFVNETATVFNAPEASTSPSRAACASNGSAGGAMVSPVSSPRSRRTLRELRVGVQAGADGGPAERICPTRSSVSRTRAAPWRTWAA